MTNRRVKMPKKKLQLVKPSRLSKNTIDYLEGKKSVHKAMIKNVGNRG